MGWEGIVMPTIWAAFHRLGFHDWQTAIPVGSLFTAVLGVNGLPMYGGEPYPRTGLAPTNGVGHRPAQRPRRWTCSHGETEQAERVAVVAGGPLAADGDGFAGQA